MKIKQIKSPKSTKALLYFGGWGSTPDSVGHLSLPEGTDYFAFYDYREISPEELPPMEEYTEIAVVGWSMGVWAISLLREYMPQHSKLVAVCGTPYPTHDDWGIPDEIFRATLTNLNEMNRERFNRRMCGGRSLTALYNSFASRSTEDLKEELTSVFEVQSARISRIAPQYAPDRAPSPFHFAWVAEKDLIVPTANQMGYWTHVEVPTRLLEGVGHYPFLSFKSWDELINPHTEND
ncbi:MAG: alpha/beta fold hydrolase [Porphyromonas sp.]|nr:alpha/beta fold hydrolase [Porphyromonas sp.]